LPASPPSDPSINVSWCDQISDLTPLAHVTSLQSLDVSWCTQISDLTRLAHLSSLQSLHLRGCDQISNVTPLRHLTGLQSLNLSGCNQIGDLTPLAQLTCLQSLDLSYNGSPFLFAPIKALLSGLRELRLFDCRPADLPPEICGESDRESVLAQVVAHYADLDAGLASDTEVRVLILGNGGAGKSQLCRRLRGLDFDPSVATTHGIHLDEASLSLDGFPEPIRLNLWDFGGQEVYHGSHALFVHGHAVFPILWRPELENRQGYEENGILMRHRPLPYWLDYVRTFAGADRPILLIQSQCDTVAQRIPRPPVDGLDGFTSIQILQASAKTGLGLDLVKASLKEAVRDCVERRPPPPIGSGRARVRSRLRELLAKDRDLPDEDRRYRWIERELFDRLCEEEGGVSDTEALLDFLYQSGVVFYRRGLFGGRIVLDQNWALDAIYALFDRRKVLPAFRGDGRFRRTDLRAFVWSQYNREEQMVFLGMMEGCGICFRTRWLSDEEWEYIAPELLPEWSEAQETLLAGRLLQVPPTEEVSADYTFLHEGVLRNFLSRIGQRAGNTAIYWKYGCWFYEKTTDSRVVIDSGWQDTAAETGAGFIRFRAWGQRARELIEPLLGELRALPVGQPPRINWKKTDAAPVRVEALASLAGLDIATAVQAPAGERTVYVSYAWGDDSSALARQRGLVVEEMCATLGRGGWKVIRDRSAMRYGDLITDFIKTLTRADRIIVVLSEKYLHSPWCMAELFGVYQRSSGEKAEFLERVVPLALEDAKFGTWRERVEIAKFWSGEFEAMEREFRHLGAPDLALYKAMQDWHNRVGDILDHVNAVLQPRGFDSIVRDDFAALKEMVEGSRRSL